MNNHPSPFVVLAGTVAASLLLLFTACSDDGGSSSGGTSGTSGTSGGGTSNGGTSGAGTSGSDASTSGTSGLPKPEGEGKRIFVTSGLFGSDLGGPSGADAKCAAAATAAKLDGTFKAWLGIAGETAASRQAKSDGNYIRIDKAIIAESFTDLTDGSIAVAIELDETGVLVRDPRDTLVWTGTTAAGAAASDNCNEFAAKTGQGTVGDATAKDGKWSESKTIACSSGSAHLYCIEQ